jgi:hypothetical protein
MLLELVFSQPPRLHPIRWLAEAGDASFEPPSAAPLPAQFVNVPVGDAQLDQAVVDAVDAAIAELNIPQAYEHVQSTPSIVWTVNHNLGRSPGSVRVLSPGGVELFADVLETSLNQLTVSFVVALTGRVLVF